MLAITSYLINLIENLHTMIFSRVYNFEFSATTTKNKEVCLYNTIVFGN